MYVLCTYHIYNDIFSVPFAVALGVLLMLHIGKHVFFRTPSTDSSSH